ncbi:hypothetical protein N865_01685 [Intrasporangium oryzae NRRL B-24470]|uniref:Metallo-beta-lactamase domain-containing protein n=1 Tax=Intrasporangium oryzae NRRL B-24470 TaxID=1386089 RepID=W9GE99_9MICO|nr:ComEC/Rec2 family competence protein [Intrasporangium oryzae]EWT03153.1 hypothetical protein N865_01685 [Intrasporangium oryzae NRRL B-24470]
MRPAAPSDEQARTRRIVPVERRVDLRLLVPVLVAWPCIAFGALLAPVTGVWCGSAVATLVAAMLVGRRTRPRPGPRRRLVALTLAVIALLLVSAAGHRTVRSTGPLEELASEGAVVTIRGTVLAEPRAVAERGARPGGEASAPARFVVRVDVAEVLGRGTTTAVSAPVLVIGGVEWGSLAWHDDIRAVVRLGPSEPGDDVVAVAKPKGSPQVTGRPGPVLDAAADVRARFRAATAALPADARGLVPALVIGDTSRTPVDLTQAMLDTGMSHLSAVSGSNVTLVLAAAMGGCGLLGVRRRFRPAVALAVLVGFVTLAHPEPSVVRAAVMGCVGLLALSTSRRQAGVPALSGAVTVLLVWDPWLARSYGFALSSVATLGLLLFAQPWGRAIGRRLPPRMARLGPVLAVPVAAQAVCTPIVVPLQGSVSLIAVVANLLAAPLVAPTTIVGVAVALLSVAGVGAAGWVAWGAALPALGIARVARVCADAPFGSVDWDGSAAGAALLAVATALLIALGPWLWHRSRLRPMLAVAVVLVISAFAVPTAPLVWPPTGWVLVACDVGQGDGLVVRTGPDRGIVVDAGPDPGLIDGCLDRLGVAAVDVVVLTHFHADHVDGLPGVLEGRRVGELLVSPVADPPGESAQTARTADDAHIPVHSLHAGQSIAVGPVMAEVWWPARRIDAGSVPNNGSVVLTLHVSGITVLLAGDIEREAAAEVVRRARADPVRWGTIDVLKVAHHGSSNRDDRLLDEVDGRLAVISVGEDNDYGHPAPSTLHALAQRGFEVHRTDIEGDVAFVVTAAGIVVRGRDATLAGTTPAAP